MNFNVRNCDHLKQAIVKTHKYRPEISTTKDTYSVCFFRVSLPKGHLDPNIKNIVQ